VICCILILYSDDLQHWVAPGRTAYSFSLHENKLHFIKNTFGPILLSLLDYRSSVMAASLVFRTMNAKSISSCALQKAIKIMLFRLEFHMIYIND
jgi:hypothetical protein